jgi:hypothetical protein
LRYKVKQEEAEFGSQSGTYRALSCCHDDRREQRSKTTTMLVEK